MLGEEGVGRGEQGKNGERMEQSEIKEDAELICSRGGPLGLLDGTVGTVPSMEQKLNYYQWLKKNV